MSYRTQCFVHLCSARDNSDRLVTIPRHFHALYGYHYPKKETPPEKKYALFFADLPRKTQLEHIMTHIYSVPQYSKKISQRYTLYYTTYRYSNPVTGLEWPRGFQEVKVPTLHDNGTGWW
jgi:hypothetical protein